MAARALEAGADESGALIHEHAVVASLEDKREGERAEGSAQGEGRRASCLSSRSFDPSALCPRRTFGPRARV